MKLPFMTRKKHESIVIPLCEDYGECLRSSEKLHTTLRRILHKFATIRLCCFENDYTTWRLVLDLDPRPLLFPLEKGGNHFVIEQIAEEFKLRVIEELSLFNIQHPDNLGLEK